MKLDPVIKNYLSSNRKNQILVFIKLKTKELEDSNLYDSTETVNSKQANFKKEINNLFSSLKNYTINSYLYRLSTAEVVLEKEDLNSLINNSLISDIQAIKEIL